MQVTRITCEGNTKLAVIVLGWASGLELVAHIRPQGYDLLVIYDYTGIGNLLHGTDGITDMPAESTRHFPPENTPASENNNNPKPMGDNRTEPTGTAFTITSPEELARLRNCIEQYPSRVLVAWSFGVRVAESLFGGIVFGKATALNGTPFPADEQNGIGARRLAVTLRGLSKGGIEPFNLKAYGEFAGLALSAQSGRTTAEHIRELEELTELSADSPVPSIDWTGAIVGTGDAIFPPENMLRYWGNRAKSVNLLHYPFGDANILEELF